eukprot:TRINITY_DN88084_c0_g1_i1.p1 TRINITY_DN88084_c0_g1~~TRINITY_DN88084_c0_g1_i1.p1  ORF type:complete len:567 (+),score=80.67 TRINITY_DN88084_c0_g1_i1:180-1703(+)
MGDACAVNLLQIHRLDDQRSNTSVDVGTVHPWCGKPERAEWLNTMLGPKGVWPKMQDLARHIIIDKIAPQINDQIPGHVLSVKFEKIDLGSRGPEIGEMSMCQNADKNGLKMRVGFSFGSGVDMKIKAGYVPLGLRDLTVTGTALLRLDEFIPEVPLVGGVSAALVDPPTITYSLTGVAKVANLPGLSGIIKSSIDKVVASMFVLPNRYAVALGTKEQGVNIARLRHPRPMMILRLSVEHAGEFPKTMLGLRTPKPYAVVKLGDSTWQTSTAHEQNPAWPKESYDFLVFDMQQQIQVSFYDKHRLQSDELVGSASIEADQVLEQNTGSIKLKLQGSASKSFVSLGVKQLNLVPGRPRVGSCVLAIDVDKVVMPLGPNTSVKAILNIYKDDGNNLYTTRETQQLAPKTGVAPQTQHGSNIHEVNFDEIFYIVLPPDIIQNGAITLELSTSDRVKSQIRLGQISKVAAASETGKGGEDVRFATPRAVAVSSNIKTFVSLTLINTELSAK